MRAAPDNLISYSLLVTSDGRLSTLANLMRPHLEPGDTLLLSGPIGAGKSHFARAIIRGFLQDSDRVEDIPSPTFTLVQTYLAGSVEIWHSDLYRLSHVDEVAELGMTEAFDSAICLVEWPDRLGDETPDNALSLQFALVENPDHRQLTLAATDEKWRWISPALDQFEHSKDHLDA